MPRLILWALIALIIFLPIPFGGVLPWAWSAMGLSAGILMSLWGVSVLLGGTTPWHPPFALRFAGILFIAVIVWAMLQAGAIGPATYHHPLWKSASDVLGSAYQGTISLDPAASRESALRILAYGGIFWLALQLARQRNRAYSLLNWICLAVSLNALYGLFVYFSRSHTVLWFDKPLHVDAVSGTFVNQNSFATFTGLALLCTTALLWQRIQSAAHGIADPAERRRLMLTQALERNRLLTAGWFVLAVTLLLTASRAGAAATIAALLVLIIALGLRRPRPWKSALVPAAIALVVLAFLFPLSGTGLDVKLNQISLSWPGRLDIYDRTLLAIRDAPLAGTGLGTFDSVFRFYGTDATELVVEKAHSDYLELALELGLPAAITFMTSLAAVGLICAGGAIRRSRDLALPCIGLSACVLVGLHSAVDFSLQIPAVALVYCVVLGIAASQAVSTRE